MELSEFLETSVVENGVLYTIHDISDGPSEENAEMLAAVATFFVGENSIEDTKKIIELLSKDEVSSEEQEFISKFYENILVKKEIIIKDQIIYNKNPVFVLAIAQTFSLFFSVANLVNDITPFLLDKVMILQTLPEEELGDSYGHYPIIQTGAFYDLQIEELSISGVGGGNYNNQLKTIFNDEIQRKVKKLIITSQYYIPQNFLEDIKVEEVVFLNSSKEIKSKAFEMQLGLTVKFQKMPKAIAEDAFENSIITFYLPIKKEEFYNTYPQPSNYGALHVWRIFQDSSVVSDTDFIGFTYNGYHSIDDLKIYRTSNGDRYNLDVVLQSNDTTAEHAGINGTYFLKSNHSERVFVIDFAFDGLYDEDISLLRTAFVTEQPKELIFDEWPYKTYDAKINQPPVLKYICFDTEDGRRLYRGEGTISFVCFNPYAHTPSGRIFLEAYPNTPTKQEWAQASGLKTIYTFSEGCNDGRNDGELPAPFVLTKLGNVEKDTEFQVGQFSIKVLASTYNLKWDSKTGMVSGTTTSDPTSKRKAIPVSGNTLGAIPVGGLTSSEMQLNGATLEYDYWYY